MNQSLGRASICLEKPVYILNSASVVGTKEGEGPLGPLFDMVGEDDMFGCNTWEEAESNLQKDAVYLALGKTGLKPADISFIFAGDLLGQSIATSFGIATYEIPLLGVYGACSTCGESMTVGAMAIAGGFAERVLCVTSSHFASAEKEFRFPLEYGGQRPPSTQWTATAAGAAIVSKGEGSPFIKAVTFGTVEDLGINDQNNMGAAMAPAAAETLSQFFKDTYTDPEDYDLIVTGDLGFVGANLMKELMERKGFPLGENYNDCGLMLYDREKQQVESGASGCGCSAAVLSGHVLPKLKNGVLKSVLAVSTGALMSPTSVQQGETIPGIAHLICFSSEKGGIF